MAATIDRALTEAGFDPELQPRESERFLMKSVPRNGTPFIVESVIGGEELNSGKSQTAYNVARFNRKESRIEKLSGDFIFGLPVGWYKIHGFIPGNPGPLETLYAQRYPTEPTRDELEDWATSAAIYIEYLERRCEALEAR